MAYVEVDGTLLILVVLLTCVALVLSPSSPGTGHRLALALRLFAAVSTVLVAATAFAPAWQESGAFALALVGIPIACAVVVAGFSLAGHPTAQATRTAAAVMLAWSLLTSLVLILAFLGPAVLMTVAAVASSDAGRAADDLRGR